MVCACTNAAQMWLHALAITITAEKYYNYMHWTVLCRANLTASQW